MLTEAHTKMLITTASCLGAPVKTKEGGGRILIHHVQVSSLIGSRLTVQKGHAASVGSKAWLTTYYYNSSRAQSRNPMITSFDSAQTFEQKSQTDFGSSVWRPVRY